MRIEVKAGVLLGSKCDTPAMARMLCVLLMMPRSSPDWPAGVTITSGEDGAHAPNSRHYVGDAIDLRSHDFPASERDHFKNRLAMALGPQFTVLREQIGTPNEHFHVQVRKAHIFDPTGL